jgi:hypothetical protein
MRLLRLDDLMTSYTHGRHIAIPEKFYKGRSQEKTQLQRLEFFLLRSPIV